MNLEFRNVNEWMKVAQIPYEMVWKDPHTITCSYCKTRIFICREHAQCTCGRVYTQESSLVVLNPNMFKDIEV